MPYIGNIPATQFAALTYQDLTGGSGTSFTLNTSVGSAQDIEVFVNNVRQEPGVAYTISGGTTLNMTGTIASTDDFYVVFQGKAVGTVTHPPLSALQATTGTFSSNVAIGGNLTVTGTSPGNLTGIQTFTADGTYTPTAGTTKVLVYVVGGGGAGGGADGDGGNTGTSGGGGGGGATSIKFISTGLGATETVTVGAGGTGNSTGNGGAGGTSSFGSHATATGGGGGKGGTGGGVSASATTRVKEGGSGGNISSGVGDVLISGQAGGNGISGSETNAAFLVSGEGGSSHLGGGAKGIDGLDNGIDAVGYGGGGGGASSFDTTGNRTGGGGANGIVVIYEYQ